MKLFDNKFVHFMWDDSLEGKEGFFADCIDTLVERVNNNIRGTVGAYQVFGTCSYGVDSYPFSVNNTCCRYSFFYYDPNYSCKWAYMEGKVIQFRYRYDGDGGEWKPCEPQWRDECEYRVKPETEMWTACIDNEGIINIMLSREWNKGKGRQMIEGTEEKCKDFAIGNYCDKCARNASCAHQWLICDGKTLDTATRIDAWYCQGFMELKPVKKRRKTNRELAKWIAQGNGQVKDIRSSTITSRGLMYDDGDDDNPCPGYLVVRGWDETGWSEPLIDG